MKGLVDACSSNTVGLIYAGGKATRMGGINKAFACFEGRRLIDHVLDTLRAQCSRVIISANRDLDEFAGMADAVLPDVGTDFPGPLGALAAFSLLHLPDCEWVLTAPCDAPRAPRTLLLQFAAAQREASDRGSASSAFFAFAGGRPQPAFALLHVSKLPAIARYLARDGQRLGGALRAVGAQQVDFDDAAAFVNLNSEEDCRSEEKNEIGT